MTIKCILGLILLSASVTYASDTTGNSLYNSEVTKCLTKYNYAQGDCNCAYYRSVQCKGYYYNGEGTSYRPNNLGWDKVCAECCCLCKFFMYSIVIC
jgi:hypothetical protein